MKKYIRERHGEGLPPWAPWPESLVQAVQEVRDQVRRASEAKFDKVNRRRPGGDGTQSEYLRIDQAEEGNGDTTELEHATLRNWCENFCRDERPLKEFRVYKNVYGWDFDSLHVGKRFRPSVHIICIQAH